MVKPRWKTTDFEELEAYLLPRYRQMPRTMLRYAIEKFPEPERPRYFTFYTVFLQLRRYFSQRGGGIAILARTSVDE